MPLSFYHFVDLVIPGWEFRSARFINRRLRRISPCCVTFKHRSGRVLLCRLRFVETRVDQYVFNWRGKRITVREYFAEKYGLALVSMNVEEYFQAKYGLMLASPNIRLIALQAPREGDFAEGELFPGELILIN
ncbi:unnamed protein product [Caenorhabditis brenneri]